MGGMGPPRGTDFTGVMLLFLIRVMMMKLCTVYTKCRDRPNTTQELSLLHWG